MYNSDKIERLHRRKAFWFTLLFYTALLGSLYVASSEDAREYLPTFIQEWFNDEVPVPPERA